MMDKNLKQDLLQLQIDQTNFRIKVKEFLEKHPEVNRALKEYFVQCRDPIDALSFMMKENNEELLIDRIEMLRKRVV
jgi:hypothetical protein